MISEFIESHTISIQVSNIFKHLNPPKFDSNNTLHKKISELSEQAHHANNQTDRLKLISQINTLTDQLIQTLP